MEGRAVARNGSGVRGRERRQCRVRTKSVTRQHMRGVQPQQCSTDTQHMHGRQFIIALSQLKGVFCI
jgi:hypothetical protein